MKLYTILLLLLIQYTYAIEIKIDLPNGTWEMLSEFALGVWKYANTTTILPTIPHT